jgi:hypothetical protein
VLPLGGVPQVIIAHVDVEISGEAVESHTMSRKGSNYHDVHGADDLSLRVMLMHAMFGRPGLTSLNQPGCSGWALQGLTSLEPTICLQGWGLHTCWSTQLMWQFLYKSGTDMVLVCIDRWYYI